MSAEQVANRRRGAEPVIAELAERAEARAERKQRRAAPAERSRIADAQPLSQRLAAIAELAEIRDHEPSYRLVNLVGTLHPGGGERPHEIEGSITVADLRTLQGLAERAGL